MAAYKGFGDPGSWGFRNRPVGVDGMEKELIWSYMAETYMAGIDADRQSMSIL
jgi:hypothetical protein